MIQELKERYHRNLFRSVIPFWERYSLDWKHGGQLHCLTRDGKIWDTRKYVWMQGRAVWMFSRLYNEVEQRPQWLSSARLIMDFLLRHAWDRQGRAYFNLTQDGRPVYLQRKPYSAFFLVLALSEYCKTGAPCKGYIEEAKRLFGAIREWMIDPSHLGRPSLPGQVPTRQLADIMVLASMAMELLVSDGDPVYRDMLRRCLNDVRHHYLEEKRTLLENIPLDGSDPEALPETRVLCPGSAIEVAWFLLHAIEVLREPNPQMEQFLFEVIEGSLELGWDKEYGGIYYYLDSEGLPSPQLEAQMKLWWPHTEAIYALVLAYSRTGDARWLKWLKKVDEYTFRCFVDWDCGEWFGYADRQGRVVNQLKGGPYKGFFHVPRALLFSLQRMEQL